MTMPILPIVLQQRHVEVGRIRLGNQVPTASGKTRPNKLDKFRFTSPIESTIRELAELYGGEPREWMNQGKKQWEVFSEANTIAVIVLKDGLSQWMETRGAGGLLHKCDGVNNVLTEEPCDPRDPDHINAKPTTRIGMLIRELGTVGAFRLETHGWNAAAELPAIASLAQMVGDMVPAELHLVERTSVKDGKTSQFVVPVLDLKITAAKLNEVVAAKMGEPVSLPSRETRAIEAAPTAAPVPNYLEQAQQCSTTAEVGAIWRTAHAAGHLTDELAAQLTVVGDALKNAAPPATPAAAPDSEGVYDAEVVDEGAAAAADAVWFQIVAEAGKQGATGPQVQDGYSAFSGGLMATEASATELQAYLEYLQGAGAEQVPA